MSVKIIVDSGCDMSNEKFETLGIDVLPIYVSNDEQVFQEEELQIEQMYKRMREGETFRTSQVSTQLYIDSFEKYASQGMEAVYISLSSGISGTCDSARLIADKVNEKYGEKIYVFDSKLATMGLGYMVEKVAEFAQSGGNVNQIIKMLEFYRDSIKQFFSVTSLEFLMRGGRISRGEAILGGLLNIRPMLRVVPENGKLEVYDKARGDKAMIKKFMENLSQEIVQRPLIIGYGDSVEYAIKVRDAIGKQFNVDTSHIRFEPLGPVVGVHVGPEFISIHHLQQDESEMKLD